MNINFDSQTIENISKHIVIKLCISNNKMYNEKRTTKKLNVSYGSVIFYFILLSNPFNIRWLFRCMKTIVFYFLLQCIMAIWTNGNHNTLSKCIIREEGNKKIC